MKAPWITAAQCGLYACSTCGLVSRPAQAMGRLSCSRCGQNLYLRRPDSIGRTWALLIAACILYVPANVLPVMETGSLFGAQTDTIMSGVVYLWTSGSWPLAVVVFFASVTVPILKILALSFLLISVQLRSRWRP